MAMPGPTPPPSATGAAPQGWGRRMRREDKGVFTWQNDGFNFFNHPKLIQIWLMDLTSW